MTQKYLVSYQRDHDNTTCYHVFEYKVGASWRELQKKFDPHYRYNYLQFFVIDREISFIKGE